jgi:hypothetical protein
MLSEVRVTRLKSTAGTMAVSIIGGLHERLVHWRTMRQPVFWHRSGSLTLLECNEPSVLLDLTASRSLRDSNEPRLYVDTLSSQEQ